MSLIFYTILIILVLVGIGIIIMAKKKKLSPKGPPFPEGHYQGLGIALGLPIGIPIGLVLGIVIDNLSLGIALGPAFGVAIGSVYGVHLEKKNKKNIRPLNKEEKKVRKWSLKVGFASLALGLIVLVAFYLLR